VLAKPGAFSEDDWRMMRAHPDYGYRLANAVPGFGSIAQVIRQHHERYDGTGYPVGLAARDIRPEARLIAVCDAWAAMLSDRPHHDPRTVEVARAELRDGRGTQFDPDMVDLFLDLHQAGRVGKLAGVGEPEKAGLYMPPGMG
jgi:two-component system cell cycle response regulator